MNDLCLRLLIQPRKGVYNLDISIAAVPITLDKLRHIQANYDLLSLPCVRVGHCVGQHLVIFPGQERATKGDGLPAFPVPPLTQHWSERPCTPNNSLNMVSLANCHGLMFPAGGAAPILLEFNATYIPEEEEDSSDDGAIRGGGRQCTAR